ncbi:MAG: dTDP-4-dehydrorhamnose 3,5-epimerase [Hydrococcus sp. Prado102]|jgi:dTDP-4-dehydrorhamnose 3,5-epimerase-like enzyme|nr:dTDP-4-dehydrorhamnose 3,5-epimerase [Hydrococcus sp. Prado102]
MGLSKRISIRQLESMQGGMTQFYTPQSSDETMLVQLPANAIENLFVHRKQTDQLLVVKGSFVLVTLENRHYRYLPLSDRVPQVATIPPGVLHGAINLSSEPCLVVNAVLRHGQPNERDYIPRQRPFHYDLDAVREALNNHFLSIENGETFSVTSYQ